MSDVSVTNANPNSDGCGVWSGFRLIALPLAAPGLAATGVLCFILSWNDFFYALILTRTKAMTAPVQSPSGCAQSLRAGSKRLSTRSRDTCRSVSPGGINGCKFV
jgi:ABC-type spermidine/putrescine transport system permease subunit II